MPGPARVGAVVREEGLPGAPGLSPGLVLRAEASLRPRQQLSRGAVPPRSGSHRGRREGRIPHLEEVLGPSARLASPRTAPGGNQFVS